MRKKLKTDWSKRQKTIKRVKSRREITDEDYKDKLIWRPLLFKTPEELINSFNNYIKSCLIKQKRVEKIPVNIVDKEEKWKDGMLNEVEYRYEEVTDVKWKTTPSIWGFLAFCWWIGYTTFETYAQREMFKWTISDIKNYLESVLIEQASKWEYNPAIAQFVLNTTYNRVPRSKSEVIEKQEPLNEEDFIED